jgi:membrane-associated phospholipid phosphatase
MQRPTWGYKLALLALFTAAYGVFYVWPNFWPLFAPTFLPLLDIDRSMPFLPWTFVIYLSDYVLFTAVFFLINDMDEWNAFARMGFATLFVCGAFFLFFPTTYPRPNYPEVTNPIVAFCMNLIANADSPNNCFPSMHVAMTSAGAWSLRHKPRGVFLFFVLWTLAIIVSTMTTKQHYFMDVVGGLGVVSILALLDWYLSARGVWNRPLAKAFARRAP